MSWLIVVGHSESLTVYDYPEIRVSVAAAHMVLGVDAEVAVRFGTDAMKAAQDRTERHRWNRHTEPLAFRQQMNNGLWLEVRSGDYPDGKD